MIAVLTDCHNRKLSRKITKEVFGEIAVLSVGKRVSTKKLKKALLEFDRVIFAGDFNRRGIAPTETGKIKEEFIFNMFVSFCLSAEFKGDKVGVFDMDGRFFTRLISVINRVPCTVICTETEAEVFCRLCISETGACPDVVSPKSYLYDCDVVFSPDGLLGFSGVLFSNSGIGLKTKAMLPECCDAALNLGVDPVELAAVMSASKNTTAEI